MRVSLLQLAVVAAAGVAADFTYATHNFTYEKLWDLQNHFYQRFVYPNNIAEAANINSTIFSEDVEGRVSDTRNFVGRELNTEYIFGLFTPTDAKSVIGRPLSYDIIQFAANGNIASATTSVQFIFPTFKNASFPVVIDTWLTWNDAEQITQYDVTFRWFGYLLQTLVLGLDPTNSTNAVAQVTETLATSICSTHDTYCTGSNQQYASNAECLNFLTTKIRLGQSFELGMDTLFCRSVHEIMIKPRPDVHCPHIGVSGGGMCDDTISYRTKATENFFTNNAWVAGNLPKLNKDF
ncbi:hypothetical protein BDV96DRAFT_596288 [Lophiotrema nucula]|uniref:Secreted protein n=1 Tax=Lophiotrema nucula TaxID=690887 RepID=A0A6A5ZJ54_9PLEO|nr:hypothetical protein BDV96DRAFT_596288 [Lophiotrema nucula]